jgi:23S rRNA (cytosine1962-C5)-methyltransferase
MTDLTLLRHAGHAVRRGHPWLYREAIAGRPPARGGPVRLLDESRAVLGHGVFDPESPLAVRVWTVGPSSSPVTPSLLAERLGSAIARRRHLFGDGAQQQTTAFRLANGEGDRVPGVVVDRYGSVAVLRTDGDAAAELVSAARRELEGALRAAGITTLLWRTGRGDTKALEAMFGDDPRVLEVREHGVPFRVDLERGQKTGAFLDQRENRRRVGELVRARADAGLGTRTLNLFSYQGGFSQRAALAGATVTSVDVASGAHAVAIESFKLASLDPRAHVFVSQDAFAFLEQSADRGQAWDVIVSDPPSFAPSEKAKKKGLAAYRSLHRACSRVLAPGGVFVAASCSSHVTMEDFLATLDDAALGRSDLSVLELHGPPPDHPSVAAFPEGRYLKLVVLA